MFACLRTHRHEQPRRQRVGDPTCHLQHATISSLGFRTFPDFHKVVVGLLAESLYFPCMSCRPCCPSWDVLLSSGLLGSGPECFSLSLLKCLAQASDRPCPAGSVFLARRWGQVSSANESDGPGRGETSTTAGSLQSHQRRGSRTGPALLIIIMIVFWSDFQHILVGGKSANASAPGLCTYYNLPQA